MMFDILCAVNIYCAPPKPIDPPDGHVMIAGLSGRERVDEQAGRVYPVYSTFGPSVICNMSPTTCSATSNAWSVTTSTYAVGGGGPIYVIEPPSPPDPGDGPG